MVPGFPDIFQMHGPVLDQFARLFGVLRNPFESDEVFRCRFLKLLKRSLREAGYHF